MDITGGIRFDRESDHMAYKYDRRAAGRISNINDTTYKPLNSVQVLPKLSISYSLENSNIYALISKGYKTGGFNSTFERPEDLTFEPEYSWNYEIGTKMAFLHKKLFATVSLFYIDWKNQQIYQTTPSGTGSMLKNAGKSYSKGLELGINAGEFTGFELSANYGFTYAKFTEYTLNQSTNYNGHFIPYVPRNTVSTQIRKTFGIQNSKFLDKIILSALYKGTGDIYWDEKNAHKQSYYSLLDGRISFVIKNNLQFDIWADNLGSTEYQAFYFEALGKSFVQMGKPLQAGVKLSMKF